MTHISLASLLSSTIVWDVLYTILGRRQLVPTLSMSRVSSIFLTKLPSFLSGIKENSATIKKKSTNTIMFKHFHFEGISKRNKQSTICLNRKNMWCLQEKCSPTELERVPFMVAPIWPWKCFALIYVSFGDWENTNMYIRMRLYTF